MRRGRMLAGGAALFGAFATASSIGCSAETATRAPKERLGTSAQRLVGATKVCQLIGDTDYETGAPTKSLTATRYGVRGTDLGYPVYDSSHGLVWFLFGDMFPSGSPDLYSPPHAGPDPLGFTDAVLPADGCPTLSFVGPGGGAFTRMTLVGHGDLGGFEVPTGATYDPVDNRILAGFMHTPTGTPSAPSISMLAYASIGAVPYAPSTTFYPVVDDADHLPILNDPAHFLIMAPVIAKATEVPHAEMLPGSSDKVLLLFGTGQPYRASAVYLAAVRMDLVTMRDAWSFMDGSTTMWSAGSVPKPLFPEQPPVNTSLPNPTGCAGEISVSFNAVFRKWMMTYKCERSFAGGRRAGDGIVVLRTATNPVGPWSTAIPLFVPQKDGLPQDADPAYGAFVHRGNLRMRRGGLLDELQLLPDDPPDQSNPDPLPTSCVPSNGFPPQCPPPVNHDPTGRTECCTNPTTCCDAMFDKIDIHVDAVTGKHEALSSGREGSIYAPYIVQPWSVPLDPSHKTQRIYYVVSTSNPYTVVLMSNELTDNDHDNDGVDDEGDHCPASFDPKQENCNGDAEDAWNELHQASPSEQVPKLGDACDPVPCPTAPSTLRTTVRVSGSCTNDKITPSVCGGRQYRDVFDYTPVGSSPLTEIAKAAIDGAPKNIPVEQVGTDTRFCQHVPPDFNCFTAPGKNRDDEINQAEAPNDSLHMWRRVTLRRVCAPNEVGCINGETLAYGMTLPLDYGTEKRRFGWKFEDDASYWTANGLIPAPANGATCLSSSVGPGTCLDGRWWTHGRTFIGKDADGFNDWVWDPRTSIYQHVGAHGEELANWFAPAAPDRAFVSTTGGIQMRPFFFLVLTLPDPAPFGWEFANGTLVSLVDEEGGRHAVLDDGRRAPLDAVFTTDARAGLDDATLTWLAAAEPTPFAGNASRPVGIALRMNGDIELPTSLVKSGNVIDIGPPPQAGAGVDGRPRARIDYAAVYSRARGRVLIVGGRDASTGAPLRDAWVLDLDRGAWKAIPRIGPELFDVVSATYSYRDDALWVVDRDTRDPNLVTTRLLRVEPATGSWDVVWSTQPSPLGSGAYSERLLGIDANGSVVLTATNASPQRHRVAVIAPRPGGYDVSVTSCRRRALVTGTGARADLHGFVLHFRRDDNVDATCVDDPQPELGEPNERLSELPLQSGTVSDLEDLLR